MENYSYKVDLTIKTLVQPFYMPFPNLIARKIVKK